MSTAEKPKEKPKEESGAKKGSLWDKFQKNLHSQREAATKSCVKVSTGVNPMTGKEEYKTIPAPPKIETQPLK